MTIQISIIIPLFNAVAVLPRALASIAQQDIFMPESGAASSAQKISPQLHPHQIEVMLPPMIIKIMASPDHYYRLK